MELRHLRYFEVLCEELHFARAAVRLRIAQPALSIQIKNLEQELGTTLFSRTKRKVELTQTGYLFLEEAKKTLAQASKAVDTARRAERGELGRIVIDFTRHAAYVGVLSACLGEFNKCYRGVELVLREVSPLVQFDGLKNDAANVAFVTTFDGGTAPEFSILQLARTPMVIALPAFHPLSRHRLLSPEDLRSEPFVVLNVGEPMVFEKCLGFLPRVVQSVTGEISLLSLVAAGLGIAMVPESVSALDISQSLKFRRLKPPEPEINVGLAFRVAAEPVVKAFLACAPSVR